MNMPRQRPNVRNGRMETINMQAVKIIFLVLIACLIAAAYVDCVAPTTTPTGTNQTYYPAIGNGPAPTVTVTFTNTTHAQEA